MIIAIVAVAMALIAALLASMLFSASEQSKLSISDAEQTVLNALKLRINEFSAKNGRLPTVTEYESQISKGLTDSFGRVPIYLFASTLDETSSPCSESASPITHHECGSDTTCTSPRVTSNVPFALVMAGTSVANTAAIINQTSPQSASAEISTATTLTTFSPGLTVGSQADRTIDTGKYDDRVILGSFTELWMASECKSSSQGDITNKGTAVRILNTAGSSLPNGQEGVAYSSSGAPFVAYGASTSNYSWSVSGLPSGISLVPSGSQAYLTGTPASGAAGTYTITIGVTATHAATGNTATHSTSLNLFICGTAIDTGSTQTLSCGAGYSGSITQKLIQDTCSGTTQWVTQSNTCALIPVASETIFNASTLTSAGASLLFRSLGTSTLTSGDLTITAGDTGGATKYLSINSTTTTTAIGVVTPSTTGYIVSGTETLNFKYTTPRESASIVFRALGRKTTFPYPFETVTITFYSGSTALGSLTKTACTVTSETTSTIVAFNSIAPGYTFDSFTVQANGTSNFYVAGVKSCTGASCVTSLTPTTSCS